MDVSWKLKNANQRKAACLWEPKREMKKFLKFKIKKFYKVQKKFKVFWVDFARANFILMLYVILEYYTTGINGEI